jgi:hypothetical protein
MDGWIDGFNRMALERIVQAKVSEPPAVDRILDRYSSLYDSIRRRTIESIRRRTIETAIETVIKSTPQH